MKEAGATAPAPPITRILAALVSPSGWPQRRGTGSDVPSGTSLKRQSFPWRHTQHGSKNNGGKSIQTLRDRRRSAPLGCAAARDSTGRENDFGAADENTLTGDEIV